MISQSLDFEDDTVINSRNVSLRYCRFKDCATAVVAGSDENICQMPNGHEICHNLFEDCLNAVKLKVSGTQISGNIFRSNKTAIDHVLGLETEIFGNRFENCREAIVCREDLTITQNLFLSSKISTQNKFSENSFPVLICDNTFVSDGKNPVELIVSKENSPLFITKNIFYDCKIGENKNFSTKDNICNLENETNGLLFEKIEFFNKNAGDFSTNLQYGCKSDAQNRIKIEEIPQVDILEMFQNHDENCEHKHEERFAEKTLDERDLLINSMFFKDEDDDLIFEAAPVGAQALRPIGIDGELEDN
jgi:hypothetical protein